MAKIIFARTFLLALLFFFHAIRLSLEVRLSKIETASEYYSRYQVTTETMTSSRNKINLNRGLYGADDDALTAFEKYTAFEYDAVNDLHPTGPGHSPSVGHSAPIANTNNDHH